MNSTPGFNVEHRFSTVPQPPFCFFLLFLKKKKQRDKNTHLVNGQLETALENSGKCFGTSYRPVPCYVEILPLVFHGCTHFRSFEKLMFWCSLLVESEEEGTYIVLCGCLLFSRLQTILTCKIIIDFCVSLPANGECKLATGSVYGFEGMK